MKSTSGGLPEMVYAPPRPDRNLLAAEPVLGYRIYPQPPLADEELYNAKASSSRRSFPTPPTSPTAHRSRSRPHGKSAISSMAGSVSSASGESDRSYEGVIAYPAPVRTSRSSHPERLSNVSRRDVESSPTPFSDPFRSPVPVSAADVTALCYSDDEEEEEEEVNSKALRLCIYLSGFCGLVSLMNMLWVFIAVIIAVLLQPLRLCSFRQSFQEELTSLLAPLLNLQLHLIYAPVTSENYNLTMLVVIHLFSPILSIGVAVASWTAAFFWFYAALLGDPTKTDRKSDGKSTVLGLRAWWQRWLRRGLR